jgi:MFS family permease
VVTGYGALLRVPGFARLYTGLLLGRVGGSMVTVSLVLFVLARYHSPQLAGATAFFSILPGLVVSPVAGALLDRHGRTRLVVLDYSLAAISVVLLAVLSTRSLLPWPALLTIVAFASLTNPLSNSGARSLFPIIAPPHLWERANALDSSGHVVAQLVGAPVAGILIGVLGPEWALGSCGALFGGAALVMLRLPEPKAASATEGSIALNAWRGLQYVARHATLRGLALTLATFNLSWGILTIAVPVLVLDRLHQGPATVGFLWGAMGAAGLVSALIVGRMSTRGRERQLMFGAILLSAAAMALLPFANALPVVLVAIILFGAANGPLDIGLFTLRQRRTDPAWFGRAFAVSMSVNWIGSPVGSAFAGPLISSSLNVALWTAVFFALVAAAFPLVAVPAQSDDGSFPGSSSRRPGRGSRAGRRSH